MMRTVLVADDDDRARKRIARTVSACGYAVLTARTPAEVIAAVSACPISIVLIDEALVPRCDLLRLLLRAPVLILADRAGGAVTHNVAVLPKQAVPVQLPEVLKTMVGPPQFRGKRMIVPLPRRGDSGAHS